jgi:asparagine synthetase B (glutamine-hydrolysing)
MCGIVGVRDDWLVQHGRGEADVQRAVAALAWRGPDDQGVVRAGGSAARGSRSRTQPAASPSSDAAAASSACSTAR